MELQVAFMKVTLDFSSG